jgi:predicted NAD/FAD-dependent oxidoreductase/deoxyribodipyrimidine photolyase
MTVLAAFPAHLRERVRATPAAERALRDGPVVCWLHHALRTDENPALDAARALALAADRPLVVVQIVFEREPYANDRHHTFILEGAKAFARAAKAERLDFRLHVERPGHRGAVLDAIAETAGAIVTDDMPIAWWNERYAYVALKSAAPVLVVDSACVVSHNLVGRAHDRAYAFRRATEALRRDRIVKAWPHTPGTPREADGYSLPFEPVDLERVSLHGLVASCDIDHGVAPVGHTRGGLAAAEERWAEFRAQRLVHYARARNDVIQPATSRLSAYLNHGHISPLRVAREAALLGGTGPEKFLDELVIWRELAYAFARFFTAHDTPDAIPSWAKTTLAEHAHERPPVLEREMLAEGRSGDAFWDAAQLSLVRHGELHNNARMTWGKQLLRWSPNAEEAYAFLMELNDRFSLDGRSPVGYSGVLWCLGQFDHPVPEPVKGFGRVRGRVTTEQASVVETSRFAARIAPPSVSTRARVAVIGAGLAGVAAARGLEHHGHQVIVFEKSRGVGGRTATRREDQRRWDHGAPAFEVTAPWLKPRIAEWVRLGVVEPWQPTVARASGGVRKPIRNPFHEHVVATEGMSGLAKYLAAGLDIRTSTAIERVTYERGEHWLQRADGPRLGPFDAVVVTAPPAQSAELLRDVTPIAACVAAIAMAPRWVALASYSESTGPEDVLVFDDDMLAFANRLEGPSGSSWTIRATEDYSRLHLEEAADTVAAALVARFVALSGFAAPSRAAGHRWRYAFADRTPIARALVDERVSVVVAGDWSAGYGVEAALRAGREAAGRLLGALHAAHARPEPTTAPIGAPASRPPAIALG